MNDEIPEAILLELQQVRDSVRTNMFDIGAVQDVAFDLGCTALVIWIAKLYDLDSADRASRYMAALNAMGAMLTKAAK